MLDSVRHFQSPDEVRTLIDQMALLKLDVFHWHLTDDQGWRLQIRKYPQLTTIGSCREAVGVDIGITGGAHKPYCGFYTQDDVRDIVKYAAARYITVVPEIEMPGHAQASIAALPWLGSTGKRPKVSSDWGVNPYLYNSTDRTFSFMQNVLDEVMELFPSSYIHVGGDEAIKDQWQASKAVQAKMHQLGFTHEEQLQGWFIARIGAYLDEHGRRLIGWDEILDGDVPASAAVMSWRGTEGAVKAAAKGHDVVLAPAPLLYMGQVQSHRHDESQGRMPVVTLKDLYDFKVVPDGIAASNAAHVLGAEVTIFAEQTPTFRDVQHAVFPRLTALAERTWTAKPDWPSFLARMPAEMDRLRASGIDAADTAFAVAIDASYKRGKATVALSTQVDQGTIRYTTDGSTPSLASPAYTAPFDVNLPVTVTAANFVDGAPIAKPRSLAIDTMALSRRPSDALALCSGRDGSRQQAVSRSNGTYAVHYVDIMDTCWQWKGADLTGVTGITVDVDHLPWNFQLAHEAKGVVSRPRHSRRGEVEVHLDTCNGPLLARMPLPAAKSTLKGTWPSVQGTHDICIAATGKPGPMLWVLGDVQLTR
jgi:hexosaminidase